MSKRWKRKVMSKKFKRLMSKRTKMQTKSNAAHKKIKETTEKIVRSRNSYREFNGVERSGCSVGERFAPKANSNNNSSDHNKRNSNNTNKENRKHPVQL